MCPISPADSRAPRTQFAVLHEAGANAGADANVHGECAARAEPSQVSPKAPKLPSFPSTIGALKRVERPHAEVDAGEAHTRRHRDAELVGIDHPRHGDADGRQIVGGDAAFAEHVVDGLFDGGHDVFRSALPRGGALIAADDLARFPHQRGLDFRAADVDAQIEPLRHIGFDASFRHGSLLRNPRCGAPASHRRKVLNTSAAKL